ncbi:MAG: hypothetical protein IJS94_06400, partial [Clostridia bacterium]|nr:hypothetical protein [Clostridia bacterium]
MKKKLSFTLSLLLILSFLFSSIPVSAVYVTGDTVIGRTVSDSEIHDLGDGLVYNEYTYTDSRGIVQTCFTMEFNPKTSDFRSYIYHKKASYGYTITNDAKYAAEDGLQVYAAINGDFFSMETANYGTPISMYVTEGKLMCATVNPGPDWKVVIAGDGTASVMESNTRYSLTIGGRDFTSQ